MTNNHHKSFHIDPSISEKYVLFMQKIKNTFFLNNLNIITIGFLACQLKQASLACSEHQSLTHSPNILYILYPNEKFTGTVLVAWAIGIRRIWDFKKFEILKIRETQKKTRGVFFSLG